MKFVFEDMYENIDLYGFNNNVPEISREGTLLKKKPEYPFWFFIKLADYSEIDEECP